MSLCILGRFVRRPNLSLLLLPLVMSACGGGGDGGGLPIAVFPTDPATQPQPAALMRAVEDSTGPQCAAGGLRIDAGVDVNRDGVLADQEVTSTQYVCAVAGSAGLGVLVRMRAEPPGANCAQGGSQVLAGIDRNASGTLEDAEVTTSAYVCNGSPGASGSSGRDSLISFAAEPPGAACQYGGQRVLSGLDLDGNGVLGAGEVTSTAYVCSAAPADTRWIDVTGAAIQAESNTGYLANSSARTVITLPAAPSVGDWVKVSGVGTGGWTIAQNAGQRISTLGLPGGLDIRWTTSSTTGSWSSVASSTDGARLVAASTSGELYTSMDQGLTWTLRLTGQVWSGVASSSDGLRLVATTNGGSIFASTDGGDTWANDGSARAWTSVASSADGMRLTAAAYLGQIWTSADGGASWTARDSNRAWRTVSTSADGRVQVAGTNGGQLFVSTDYGITWTARASSNFWWAVSASADGRRMYATVDTGTLWRSEDFGSTWEAVDTARDWRGLATSADGRFVVAGTAGGRMYQSTDFGASWRPTGNSGHWQGIAISADGLRVIAGNTGAALQSGMRVTSTTLGVAGSLSGEQGDTVQLQFTGGGVFAPIGYVNAGIDFGIQ